MPAFPVVKTLGGAERRIESGYAGGMAHEVPNFRVLLVVPAVLGPVVGHLGVEVELAPVRQHEGAQEGHRLGRRVDVDDGVLLPRPRARLVGMARPEVDDELALDRRREGRADIAEFREVALEGIAHLGEAFVAEAVDVHGSPLKCLTWTQVADCSDRRPSPCGYNEITNRARRMSYR